jgi:hypothetical protein
MSEPPPPFPRGRWNPPPVRLLASSTWSRDSSDSRDFRIPLSPRVSSRTSPGDLLLGQRHLHVRLGDPGFPSRGGDLQPEAAAGTQETQGLVLLRAHPDPDLPFAMCT